MTEKYSNAILNRYNQNFNSEMLCLKGEITIEEIESLALKSAIYAFSLSSEEPDRFEKINISDLIDLAEELESQGQKSKMVEEN